MYTDPYKYMRSTYFFTYQFRYISDQASFLLNITFWKPSTMDRLNYRFGRNMYIRKFFSKSLKNLELCDVYQLSYIKLKQVPFVGIFQEYI